MKATFGCVTLVVLPLPLTTQITLGQRYSAAQLKTRQVYLLIFLAFYIINFTNLCHAGVLNVGHPAATVKLSDNVSFLFLYIFIGSTVTRDLQHFMDMGQMCFHH